MPWYKNGLQNPHFIRDDGSVPWIANQPMGGFKFTGAAAASASGEFVRYDEFTATLFGLKYKGTVKATTTGNITLSGAQTIDGIACAAGELVGVVAQTALVENGIYQVAAGAWTRVSNLATGAAAAGAYFQTEQGTANGERFFVCTNDSGSDVVDTDALTWSSWGGVTHHNALVDLQGGSATERYHLTAAQHGMMPTAAITTGQVVFAGASGLFSGDAGLTWDNTGKILQVGVGAYASSGNTLALRCAIADGATAVGLKIGNANALTTGGAKIASFYSDDFSTEIAYINKGGTIYGAQGIVTGSGYGFYTSLIFDASFFPRNIYQTPDTGTIATGSTGNSILICEYSDFATDFGHAQQTNPTVFIQSADATTPAQWLNFAHNQTDGVIATGAGDLLFSPAGGYIKFGTYAAIVAEVLQGYITVRDAAGNLRKLAVVA